MATTIEKFMIDVATRMSGRDAAVLDKVHDIAGGLLSTMGKLIGITGGIYGVGAALQDFVNDAVDLQRVGQATGANVEKLSTWVGAMNAAGEHGANFLQTVKSISSGIQDAFTSGGSNILPFFQELGIALLDGENNLRDVTDVIKDLAQAWESYTPQRQQKIGEMLGIDESTIRFLQQGGDEVERQLALQKALGVVNAEQAKTAKEVQTAYYQLQQIWAALSNALIARLLPAVKYAIGGLKDMSKFVSEHKSIVYGFLIGLGVIVAAITPGLVAAAAAFLGLTWPIVAIGAACAALGTALYYLIDDFLVWRAGGESAFGGLWEYVDPIVTWIEEALAGLGDFLKLMWVDPEAALKVFLNKLDELKTWMLDVSAKLFKMFDAGEFRKMGANAGKALKDAILDAWNTVTETLGNIDWAKIGKTIYDTSSAVIPFVVSAGLAIGDAILGAVIEVLGPLWDTIKNGVGSLINWLRGSSPEDPANPAETPEERAVRVANASSLGAAGSPIAAAAGAGGPLGGFAAGPYGGAALTGGTSYTYGGNVNIHEMKVNVQNGTEKNVTNGIRNGLEQTVQKASVVGDGVGT